MWTFKIRPAALENAPKLIFFCGKMAAGKSTLAREIAQQTNAVLLVQDDLLAALYPEEILTIADFERRSRHLREALAPSIHTLLSRGISVVLDFPGNTTSQRAWFRELFERAAVPHELHFVDVTNAKCKAQLAARSRHLPPGTPWTSEAEFDEITEYFQPPSENEAFNVIRHCLS